MSESDYTKDLSLLKRSENNYPDNPDDAELESFENRFEKNDYWVTFDCPEYTSLCPVTNQPDFGHITIRYRPDAKIIESKSLKLFIFSFRNFNTFHEESVNKILDKFVESCDPHECIVEGKFNPRGGISLTIVAEHKK
ncbi:MAG: NADPH-dependent 7-cyano-7-deazaguanine reductase QueF [Lentisphaeria bacterium]|nr:preQ(1) synthase [Lentisphaeria bacterium]NQZ68713.1 NADPH-dependent 7-cyano-7-deazaguanine reductase QueF [Lentisphaeria bacterium]